MKRIPRSVLPAGAVLAVVAAAALLVMRATAEPPQPWTWTPPAGFVQVASVEPGSEKHVSLWLGRVGPPKPDACWYLVGRGAQGDYAVGGCGGEFAQPWVVRFAGVVAGGTGEDAARWVRIGGGVTIAVTQSHFIAVGSLNGPTTSVELFDENQTSLAHFPEIPIGGETT